MENEIKKIEKIKNNYEKKENSKFEELKKLDSKVKRVPTIFAYIHGIVGSLVFGTGMCLAMKVIGGSTAWMIGGIVIGCVGIGLISATYFIFNKMLAKRKKKYSNKIITLSNELLGQE